MSTTKAFSLSALASACLCMSATSQAAFKMGDTDVGFGGYLKTDAMITATSDGQIATGIGRDFYVPSLTPVGGAKESANFDMHARQSRFFFTTETPLDNGKKINGRFEFDMMSTTIGDQRVTNGYSPEIRHAYVSYGNWLMGQTWTTFMDVSTLPDSLDFIGATDGASFVRQAQIRYTTGSWQFAIENPETTVTSFGGSNRIVTDDNRVPDMVARYNLKGDWGSMSFSALARELAYHTKITDKDNVLGYGAGWSGKIDENILGYGVAWSGKINLNPSDDLRFTINAGRGLGRYLSLNTANDAALNSHKQLDAIDVLGYAVAYKHGWNNQWRSSLMYGSQQIENPVISTGRAVTKATNSVTANLICQVASKLAVGVELRYAVRQLENNTSGDLLRLQTSVKYDF